MSKISKKLRAEAIELAGIDATFWANESAEHGDFEYRPAVLRLVAEAKRHADFHVDTEGTIRLLSRAAEAQAMLLEGWSPS